MQAFTRNIAKTLEIQIPEIRIAKYQRGVDPHKVKRILESFNEHRMRPIELSYRDGIYWCFDGQNRLEVFKKMGRARIPANIHFGLSYRDEAFLFAKQHENEVRINKRDEWKALCEAGDPSAQNILAACKKFGFEVGKDSKTGKGIGAIRELQKIEKRHGRRGLEDALFVLHAAFQNDPSSAHHDIVAGMGKILDTYTSLGDYEFNRLVEVLQKVSPSILLRRAMTERGRGGKQVAKTIIAHYNKGLGRTSKKRLNEHLIH